MIATFISSVYANTFYLQSYIKTHDEKQVLEMALMKENETALQSQLNALKLQINPHVRIVIIVVLDRRQFRHFILCGCLYGIMSGDTRLPEAKA